MPKAAQRVGGRFSLKSGCAAANLSFLPLGSAALGWSVTQEVACAISPGTEYFFTVTLGFESEIRFSQCGPQPVIIYILDCQIKIELEK